MAEALALAAAVMTVVQFSEQIVSICFEYIETATKVKSQIQDTIRVVSRLKSTLENLKILLDRYGGNSKSPALPNLKSLESSLTLSKQMILDLAATLGVDIDSGKEVEIN